MNDLHLEWVKCQGGVWCKLNTVNLSHEHFENMNGVYIIWHGGMRPEVVYVGEGNIRQRLQAHRSNQEIQQYDHLDLFVTWASVNDAQRKGVEAYLADTWTPKVGSTPSPRTMRIRVNSPW